MSRISIHSCHIPIQLLDKVQLLVLEIIQGHILPVEEYRLDVEVGEDLELLISYVAAEALTAYVQQLFGEAVGRLIVTEDHIAGPGIEFDLEILLYIPDEIVGRIDIERRRIDDLFSFE